MQFTPPCQELAPDRKIRVGWMLMRRKSIGGSVSVLYNSDEHDRRRTPVSAQNGSRGSRRPVRGRLQVTAGTDAESACAETAIKAERETFHLKGELQRLDMEDLEQATGRESLPEVRRGGKVVDVDQLLRQKDRHD